jgi:hypothetical protein
MLNCLYKEDTMSLEDFLNMENENNKFTINKIETASAFVMALVLHSSKVMAAGKGIDALGMSLLNMIRHWAYWILIIMCIIEVIRSGISGESKKILSIIMRYILIFLAMYLLPGIFDTIKDGI